MSSAASISILLVRPLLAALDSDGKKALFRAADLTPELVKDPDTRISAAQFCVAWSQALQSTGDPALGLAIAEATPLGAFGVVEYACRAAPTLGEALRQWVRYLGILDDAVEVGLVDAGDQLSLRLLRESEAPAPASHELCFALIVRHARALLPGRFRASAVHFTHAARSGMAGRYREFFDTVVRFGADHTELLLPKSAVNAPLTTADPNLLAVLLPAAETQHRRRVKEPPLVDQVRRALSVGFSSEDAELPAIASRLGLTARSLQRRLKDEGLSFQTLRDQTRRQLADRYLSEGLSAAEISFLLGFSEPSAFFRAFKRWTGSTPRTHALAR